MNGLTAEAKKVLRRWARSDFYVYLRPLSGVYFNQGPSAVVWVVNVEVRATTPTQVRKEGADLSKVICEVDLLVPRRSKGYVAEKPHHYTGWLAPQDLPKAPKEARPTKRRKRG